MKIKELILKNLMLFPGWRTKRKIVVIESDDWGAIRTPDKQKLDLINKINPLVKEDHYTQLDAFETNDDIEFLLQTLNSVRDCRNRPAIITANTIVANPNFKEIELSNFNQYSYLSFSDLIKIFPKSNNVKKLITQGIDNNLYKPQLHGREHLNVAQWLSELQNGNKELLEAFKFQTYGIPLTTRKSIRKNLMSAFDYENVADKKNYRFIINEAADLFYKTFGFTSDSFIATTYIWDHDLEKLLYENGVKFIQGIPYQYIPNPNEKFYKKKFHYTGQNNSLGQIYLVRNAFFEPYVDSKKDVVGECLLRIKMAFLWGKPAIVGSHRVNYIGSISEKNRSQNLKLLENLLKEIVKQWPDVEFMSSDELGRLMLQEQI